jgi:hypothetical protein
VWASPTTRLYEQLAAPPKVIVAQIGIDCGGIIFVPAERATPSDPSHHSYVWRYRLPDDVRAKLISENNPAGSITNSDLELAAAVIHPDVLAIQYDITEASIATLHDNTGILTIQRINNHNRPICLPATFAYPQHSPAPVYIHA